MVGRTLSHYKILEKIGSGGMGDVYLADDTKLDRKVAPKVLPPETATGERRMRFEREAKAIAARETALSTYGLAIRRSWLRILLDVELYNITCGRPPFLRLSRLPASAADGSRSANEMGDLRSFAAVRPDLRSQLAAAEWDNRRDRKSHWTYTDPLTK